MAGPLHPLERLVGDSASKKTQTHRGNGRVLVG